jgi:hypothetical protein
MFIVTMFIGSAQTAYNDFRNHYTLSSSALSWDAAWNACIRAGKKLAPITNLAE